MAKVSAYCDGDMKDSVVEKDSTAATHSSRVSAPRALAAWISSGRSGRVGSAGLEPALSRGAHLPAARFTMIGSLLAAAVALWVCALFANKNQSQETHEEYENFYFHSHFQSYFQRVVGVDRRAGITRILAEVLGMTASAACALPAPRLMLSNVMLIASSIALALGIALWTLPELQKPEFAAARRASVVAARWLDWWRRFGGAGLVDVACASDVEHRARSGADQRWWLDGFVVAVRSVRHADDGTGCCRRCG